MRWLLLLFALALPGPFSLLITQGAQAQTIYENVYRPLEQRFSLTTPRFKIIYPEGQDEVARRTARILEDQYPLVQSLVGGSLQRFPVVLNDHNDLSNGYVTPLHFRTEIEIPPIKGPALNPRTGGWIENVAPHELVHALHFSNIPSPSLPGLLYPFSPDLARSFHAAAPLGMIEGIAVFHETKVVYGKGGRGNYSLFRNQAHANLAGSRPWSLARHLMPSMYSMPGNRHYPGGYEFIRWLQYNYGMDITRETIEYFMRYPFLGYGKALQHVTGEWPSSLYRKYREEMETYLREEHEYAARDESHPTQGVAIPQRARDVNLSRPVWLDEHRILYAQPTQYSSRPGFYEYDARDGRIQLVYETRLVGDYIYDLDRGNNQLTFSRYVRHPYHVNAWKMDVYQLDLDSRRASRVSRDARVHAPVYMQDDAFQPPYAGLQTQSETSQLVRIEADGTTRPLFSIYPDTFVQLAPSPTEPGTHAVIANRNGLQAFWLVQDDNFVVVRELNPQVSFRNGIVHDLAWSDDGTRVLLSATREEVAQIYEYDVSEDALTQLTQSRFGATQPSYRPDAGAIAFVEQHENSSRIVTLEREHFMGRDFQPFEFQPDVSAALEASRLSDYREEDDPDWVFEPYRTGLSWLRPRSFAPLFIAEDSRVADTRFGLAAAGGDVLRRHAWSAELTYGTERLWGELFYRNSTFYPGFQLEGYYRPRATTDGLVVERGGSVHIPFIWNMDHRSRASWWEFRPGIAARQLRGVGPQFSPDWFTDVGLIGSLSYFFRLQQNIRDIQPNTGTVLFTQAEHFIISDREAEVAGIRVGINQYLSPWMRQNHGLMLGAEVLTQTRTRLYGTSQLVYQGFSENVLLGLRNAGSLRARYVLPLRYVDDGFITVPFFLDRIYLALQANYVADLNQLTTDNYSTVGRAVYGLELRANLRLFNLPLDLGIGVGYEPTRDNWEVFGGVR